MAIIPYLSRCFDVRSPVDGGCRSQCWGRWGTTFYSLRAAESLPASQTVGGYIFLCNDETMPENLRWKLFGMPSRYTNSVKAIQPGLPLFLYNYSRRQLHGVFEAASNGGVCIDPTAWVDENLGESAFPAQVRVSEKMGCMPLEYEDFRHVVHHYDEPKFRLELAVPEALGLLDLFEDRAP